MKFGPGNEWYKMIFGAAYLLISDFLVDSQSQQKLATKFFHITIRWLYKRFAVHSNPLWSLEFLIQIDLKHDSSTIQFFLKKTSSYKSHLTQQYKNYTPATQLKTLLTLQIFQKTCLWFFVRWNTCTAPFLCARKLHFQSTWKANVYIFLQFSIRKSLLQRHRKFLFGGWGLKDFLKAVAAFTS